MGMSITQTLNTETRNVTYLKGGLKYRRSPVFVVCCVDLLALSQVKLTECVWKLPTFSFLPGLSDHGNHTQHFEWLISFYSLSSASFLTSLPSHSSASISSPSASSSSLPVDQSLEQKPQGGSGFVPSWKPDVIPSVDPSPSSALALSGPPLPLPPQPHIPQPAVASPSDQDAGTK